jgi:hypothetical protein
MRLEAEAQAGQPLDVTKFVLIPVEVSRAGRAGKGRWMIRRDGLRSRQGSKTLPEPTTISCGWRFSG